MARQPKQVEKNAEKTVEKQVEKTLIADKVLHKEFKIEKIEGADAVLTVRDSATEERAIHVLTVKVKAPQPGEVQRNIRIITNLDKEREIEFHVSARVNP